MNPMDFNGVLTELQTKHADLGMAGLSPDPEREGIMDFSDIYYRAASPLCAWSPTRTSSPRWKTPITLSTPLPPRPAPSSRIWPTPQPRGQHGTLAKVTDIVAELVAGKIDGAYIETLPGRELSGELPRAVPGAGGPL